MNDRPRPSEVEIITALGAAFLSGRTRQAVHDAISAGRLKPVLYGVTESGSLRPAYVAVADVLKLWARSLPTHTDAELAAMRDNGFVIETSGERYRLVSPWPALQPAAAGVTRD